MRASCCWPPSSADGTARSRGSEGLGVNAPTPPLVSIGMPAYKSAATIRCAIDALLAQTFRDFELIVSDNASTDDTWNIVQEYAQRDPRVIGIRQERNIGANGNYSAVFLASRGRYFKWASSNDWCAPTFLERCLAHLEACEDTVLVTPRARLFDGTLENWTDYDGDLSFEQANPVDRFIDVGMRLALNNAMNGLVRADVLRQTRLIEHYPSADVVLLGHLALLGRIALIDEPLFYRRMDRATATRMMSQQDVHRHHYPVKTARALLPSWRCALGWAQAALSAPLKLRDRMRALNWVLRRAYWNKADMGSDLADMLRHPSGR
jgi:glycosyltransferase involved in cell wall biosynthesis